MTFIGRRTYIYSKETPPEKRFEGYSIFCYSHNADVITILWPTKWPAPATGTFGCNKGMLPKEYFGGNGGVDSPQIPVPEIIPEYQALEPKTNLTLKERAALWGAELQTIIK